MNNSVRIQDPVIAVVEYKDCKFVITNQPNNKNIKQYVKRLNEQNVATLVRVCEPTYSNEDVIDSGISFHDMYLDDGGFPSPEKEDEWFRILKRNFEKDSSKAVAVHCASGLGRAPVLVCIALMDLGMSFEDAVELIRTKRRGAINSKQLNYLQHYKSKSKLRGKKKRGGCVVQ